MRSFSAVLRKDLRLELRSGESTIALVAIALLVLIVLVFALNPAGGNRDAPAAAGALWIALIFAGTLGAGRALLAERDSGCMRALLMSPIEPASLYCAKLAAAFRFMIVAELAAIVLLVLFFGAFLLTALAGMPSIDAKVAALLCHRSQWRSTLGIEAGSPAETAQRRALHGEGRGRPPQCRRLDGGYLVRGRYPRRRAGHAAWPPLDRAPGGADRAVPPAGQATLATPPVP